VTSQFLEMGKLVALDSLVRGRAGSPRRSWRLLPGVHRRQFVDGRIVTLPFNKSVPVFFYNVKMLERAGFRSSENVPEFRPW